MSKQHESSFLYDRSKERLFGALTGNVIYFALRCVFCRGRVAVVWARSTCGRRVTAVVMVTAAAATVTQTASTRCRSAVPRRTVSCRGTRNLVPPRWPLPTAVEARQNDKLYVASVMYHVSVLYSSSSLPVYVTSVSYPIPYCYRLSVNLPIKQSTCVCRELYTTG